MMLTFGTLLILAFVILLSLVFILLVIYILYRKLQERNHEPIIK